MQRKKKEKKRKKYSREGTPVKVGKVLPWKVIWSNYQLTGWVILFLVILHQDIYNFPRLFKSFEFGNVSRMSDENLVIFEFKYLQNKKW